MHHDLLPLQRELAEHMSGISELGYGAGWMENLEHSLWHAIVDGPFSFGQLQITESHISKLRDLAVASGGWILLDEDGEEAFVSLAQWLMLYNRALAQN
jgi:hypothetical protein